MAALTFTTYWVEDSGLIFSPEELLAQYFYGVTIQDKQGTELSKQVISNYIRAAQQEVEKFLGIKLCKQVINESLTYYRDDFVNSGMIRTTYPVRKGFNLEGWYGNMKQLTYPPGWIVVRTTNDGMTYFRQITIIPNGMGNATSFYFEAVLPYYGLLTYKQLDDYWRLTYTTGFDQIPYDILNFVGKLASINVFHIAGDIILGAGIASQSIGIDGLSQSISTTSSATNAGYGARIQGYLKDLQEATERLKTYYRGIVLTSL